MEAYFFSFLAGVNSKLGSQLGLHVLLRGHVERSERSAYKLKPSFPL